MIGIKYDDAYTSFVTTIINTTKYHYNITINITTKDEIQIILLSHFHTEVSCKDKDKDKGSPIQESERNSQ